MFNRLEYRISGTCRFWKHRWRGDQQGQLDALWTLGVLSHRYSLPLWAENALLSFLRSSEVEVRVNSATILGRLTGARLVDALLSTLHKDEDGRVREASACSLGMMRAQSAVDALISTLQKDEDDKVRSEAALALGWLDDQAVVDQLVDTCLNDGSEDVRQSASTALHRLDGDIALDALIKAYSAPNCNQRFVRRALSGFHLNLRAIQFLRNAELAAFTTIIKEDGLVVAIPEGWKEENTHSRCTFVPYYHMRRPCEMNGKRVDILSPSVNVMVKDAGVSMSLASIKAIDSMLFTSSLQCCDVLLIEPIESKDTIGTFSHFRYDRLPFRMESYVIHCFHTNSRCIIRVELSGCEAHMEDFNVDTVRKYLSSFRIDSVPNQ